ncbi:MAG TPA: hypothetical protein VMF12_19055 [Xanthobacteraceae bacterium]|nr:hypothetical protein [Xanthobacteraceae bacterium]
MSDPVQQSATPQQPPLSWKEVLRPLVHLLGIALVLNSINTYFYPYLFPGCQTPGIAATHCPASYGDYRDFVESLGSLRLANLILRFMALIGFALDFLAVFYLIYVVGLILRKSVRRRI